MKATRLEILLATLLGAALMAIVAMQVETARAAPTDTNRHVSALFTRACAFASGGWTEVDCSAAAAYSAQLSANTRYVLQAVTGDAYFAQTSAASGQDADSSDGYLPKGAWVEISTVNGNRYYSCDGSAASATIRHIECQ